MKRLTMFMLAILLLFGGVATALAEESAGTVIDNSGSIEISGAVLPHNTDYLMLSVNPDALDTYPTFGSIFKLRDDLRISVSDQTSARLRTSYTNDSTQDLNTNGIFFLSRGFIDFSPNERLSLRLGKQRLAWGTGYAWNLTDILDEPRNAFTDSDDPEGVMAFRSDLNFGPTTVQAVITPEDSWEDSGRALRFKASPAGVDLTVGLVQNATDNTVTIADFACSLSGLGIHGEALYQAEGNRYRTDKHEIFNYLIGADYKFPGGFYLALEYYHNDEAFQDTTEIKKYCLNSLTSGSTYVELKTALTNLANNGGVTRDHYFIRATKEFGDNVNTELLLLVNPYDGSLAGQPKFEYTWKQNTTVFIKGILATGDRDSEVNLLSTKNEWNLGLKVNF
jgi:hypothetical protein